MLNSFLPIAFCASFRKYGFLLLLLLLNGAFVFGEKQFDFNADCQQAYKEIIQWKFVKGQQLLDIEKFKHPDNLIPYYLENYIDFFTLFFNEDPAFYKKMASRVEDRLDKLDEGPSSSPLYLFTKAVIHFQWAAIQVKFGHNWDAGWTFRRSFVQFKQNQNAFPDFYPNQFYRGAMQVAAGTIPDGYKWLSNLLGIKGTIKDGMSQLKTSLSRKDEWSQLYREEAIFYYCYLKFYIENDKEGVFTFIKEQQLDLVNNHLFAYLAANLSLNNHQSALAEKIITERNMENIYFQTPVWDLELGYAKSNHLDPAGAVYLEKFIAQFKGKFYVKDALQKISWHYYLSGEQEKAEKARRDISLKGSGDTEADKQALKEAQSGVWPNPLLLQSRLLSDGGYYKEALRLLHGKTYLSFQLAQDQVEFCYRAGRIYDDLGHKEDAIQFYQQTIRLGEKRKEYYAARSALHIGNIMEAKGDKTSAVNWYQRVLDMKDHDYKNSLDQKAKAGIGRCKEQ